MSNATVKIPALKAEEFYQEAIDTLAFAASNLKEGADWFMEGKGLPRLEAEDIPRTLKAISLVERIRAGELEFGAEELVRSTIEGLVIKGGDRVRECAEASNHKDTREAMGDLDLWLELLESEPMRDVQRQREARRKERQREREAVA